MSKKTMKLSPQRRTVDATFERVGGEGEVPSFDISFSSEQSVERWWGTEVLAHDSPKNAELSRINDGGVVLFNHLRDKPIGFVEKGSARIEKKKGRARVRFFDDAEGQLWRGRVERGELKTVSFAYRILDMVESKKDGESTFTATRWEPLEISLVTIPADNSVGFGRSDPEDPEASEVLITPAQPAENRSLDMDPVNPAGNTPANPTAAPVNVLAIRNEAVDNERKRITLISGLGVRFNLPALADKLIADGKSPDEAREAFLEEIGKGGQRQTPAQTPTGSPLEIDLSKRDLGQYSLRRAILAHIEKDWSGAGLEREVSQEIRKQVEKMGLTPGHGFYVPMNLGIGNPSAGGLRAVLEKLGVPKEIAERATYNTGTAGQGGNLVATELLAGSFIDILRNRALVARMGATMLTGLVGNVDIPRRATATQSFWVAEGSGPTQSEGTFDKVTLRPKTVGALSQMTRNMLLQSTPDIEALCRADIVAVLGLAIDLAAINGTGASNQPTGVMQTAGIGAVAGGVNGAAPTWANIVQLETEIAQDNADLGALGYLTNAKARGKLKTTEKAASTGMFVWGDGSSGDPAFGSLNGYRAGVSNQVPSNLTKGTGTNLSAILFGNWADLFIAMWGVLEILPNPYGTGYAAGDIQIRALQTVDVAVRHPESFAAMTDAITV
jgi:HK97 family phage major capsid protein/HK97 family phage prohead protease